MATFYFSQHAVAFQRFRIILPLHVWFQFYPDSTHWKSGVVIVPTTTPGTTGNKTIDIMTTFGFKYSFLIFVLSHSQCDFVDYGLLRYHFHMTKVAKMITQIKTMEIRAFSSFAMLKTEYILHIILRFLCCQTEGNPSGYSFLGCIWDRLDYFTVSLQTACR